MEITEKTGKNNEKILEIKEKNEENKACCLFQENEKKDNEIQKKITRIFNDLGLFIQRKNEESLEKVKEKGFFGNLEFKAVLLEGFFHRKGEFYKGFYSYLWGF